jgi:hypothetical protein
MARPKQSEPGLSVDRRQLLVTAAAVTAAGIVPNAEAVGATNSVQAASVTKAWVSETPALNVCAGTAQKIQEIAARNIIRAEAGLPLLSVPQELRRMKQATDAMAFEEFAAVHRQAIWEEVLAPVREARGEPNYRPTRWMEGLAFQAQVGKILRQRFKVAQTSPEQERIGLAH